MENIHKPLDLLNLPLKSHLSLIDPDLLLLNPPTPLLIPYAERDKVVLTSTPLAWKLQIAKIDFLDNFVGF